MLILIRPTPMFLDNLPIIVKVYVDHYVRLCLCVCESGSEFQFPTSTPTNFSTCIFCMYWKAFPHANSNNLIILQARGPKLFFPFFSKDDVKRIFGLWGSNFGQTRRFDLQGQNSNWHLTQHSRDSSYIKSATYIHNVPLTRPKVGSIL